MTGEAQTMAVSVIVKNPETGEERTFVEGQEVSVEDLEFISDPTNIRSTPE